MSIDGQYLIATTTSPSTADTGAKPTGRKGRARNGVPQCEAMNRQQQENTDARRGVLLADGFNRAGVDLKLFAASASEVYQIEAGKPFPAPLEGVLLPVVAEVPNEVNRSRLFVQKAGERFNPVAVDQVHAEIVRGRGNVCQSA